MLFHIFIMTLGTSLLFWHTDSTPFNMALITFLYYALPLIALISFYLIIAQLIRLYDSLPRCSKQASVDIEETPIIESISNDIADTFKLFKRSKRRTVPTGISDASKSRTVPKKEPKKISKKESTTPKNKVASTKTRKSKIKKEEPIM